jgi:glycosyltransferase involved in cell wall biosynthesis
MAKCRIYLLTYRRNDLLRRAINSLVNQTFTDWVCELHNDDPQDSFPEDYLRNLNDERFIYLLHDHTYGALRAFNLMYQGCNEQYVSLLEDDNWWEPQFLESLIRQLDKHKKVQVAWSNMYLWKENPDKSWSFLESTVWPVAEGKTSIFPSLTYKQAYSYLHSQGAMVVRNIQLKDLITPLSIRLDFVEPVRERAFQHPIMLIHQPLANFSVTLNTNRSKSIVGIHEHYVLLLSSYFKFVKPNSQLRIDIWNEIRMSPVRATNKLIYAGLLDKNCRFLLKSATLSDIIFFVLYNIKRPIILYRCIFAKRLYSELWNYLIKHTEKQIPISE